jgi:diguanylate cyclase (GGDEF)-like protein
MSFLRRSPVARFSVVSLVTMAALAALLGVLLQRRIADRALDSAARTSAVIGEIAVRRYIPRHEYAQGLSFGTELRLDEHLQGQDLKELGVAKVKVFNTRRELIYTNTGEVGGRPAPRTSNVAIALSGRRVLHLARGTDDNGRGEQTLSVYAPIRERDKVTGAFEVYLDYTPLAAAARNDVYEMWTMVAGGFVVLWLALFRLVRSISSALRRQVDENHHQATHDALTGLPNRTALFERLGEVVGHERAALLLVDLDGFREINDTLGHDHGDELLIEVARRLREAVGEHDLVARLGGDEFAVLHGGGGEAGSRRLADAIVDCLRLPLDVRGTTVVVDASIGVALAPEHGTDAASIARRAEVAMYQAKTRHASVDVYDPERDHHNRDRLALLGELGAAIRRDELVVAYQPKLALRSGEVRGVEALIRWQHPEHGLLGPGQFVPAAEVTSLIRPLTLHVIDASLRAHREWRRHGLDLPVAVNLAGQCVMDPTLPEAIAGLLADHDVPAEALTLEISERTMMNDVTGALTVLERLRKLGILLSLDDFGTGQTSLGQLRQLPLDEMKIDRSLVIGDERLLSSVVEIAHRFGLRAVGEGVETDEIASTLVAAGCDEAQGFLFARPMWADQVPAWVEDRRILAA